MALTLTIAAVERFYLEGTLSIQETVFSRNTARLVVQSADATVRPTKDQEIILLSGATKKFAGYISAVREAGVGGEPTIGIATEIDAVDYMVVADWRFVIIGGFVAGFTLKGVLEGLVPYLADFGVTLDGAQITGPTMPALSWNTKSLKDILDELTQVTGFVWEIDYNKVLRMYAPGGVAAAFNVLQTDDSTIGDVTVEPADTEYANRILLQFGSGTKEIIDDLIGDGVTTAFPINYYPLVAHRGYVNVNGTVVSSDPPDVTGGVNETFSIGGGGTWDYDPVTGIITRLTALGGTDVAHFIYTAQFPVTVQANEVTEQPPIREIAVSLPSVFSRAEAQTTADNMLARYLTRPRVVTYSTFRSTLVKGTAQHITFPRRNINEDGFITDIVAQYLEGLIVRYDVTWLEGDELQNTWRDTIREFVEDTSGGSVGGAAAVSTGAPALPFESVQFNRNGTFGGDEDHKYYETKKSFAMGPGSSVTAVEASGCFAFGSNCHVADP